MDLYLDIETFCEVDLRKAGAYRYAEDAEVLMVQFAADDAPVEVWETQDVPNWQRDLQDLIDRADTVVIHNSAFERNVLKRHGVNIPIEKIEDTLVLALQHGLPGGLGQLCDILGVPVDKAKDKDGKKLINLFTKPRPKNMKVRRATRETHPDEWQRFIEYARLDVDATRCIRGRIPRWNYSRHERDLWRRDQAINDDGIRIDLEFARAALRSFDRAKGTLAASAAALTAGGLNATTQRDKLLEILREEHGVDVADTTKGTVEKLLADPDLPQGARALLENRQQAASTSPSKYKALIAATCSDGRLRGTLQFCGAARTGRDAGRIFQPQNLPRSPDWFDEHAQARVIAAMKADCEDLLWDNISELCAFAVRGCIVAEDGNELVIADLSNIEGRVLAWGAGEQWKLEAFKAYDRGEGHDLYKVTAGRILGKTPETIEKHERQQMGKVPELACGYQGAVGAFRKMGGPAVEAMTDEQIEEIVWGWRAAHPRTKAFWYDLETAARSAIQNPGDSYSVRDMATFDVAPDQMGRMWLRMKLPSGRYLCYPDPKLIRDTCPKCDGEGFVIHHFEGRDHHLDCPECNGSGVTGSPRISYMGVDQYTRQWKRLDTYGGKLSENWTQATARDVFFSGLRRAMDAGYRIVLRVHDELVAEVRRGSGLTHERLASLMATNDNWNVGLPLAAAGFTAERYRKD